MLDSVEDEKPSGYYLFGTDVFSIPGFRNGFLAGLSACTGTTLLTFLFTSNGVKSFNYGFGALFAVTFPYMFYCQRSFYHTLQQMEEVQEKIKEKTNEDYIITDSLIPDSVV